MSFITSSMKKKSITQTSIFGDYKKPEDRVTAALLHIIHIGGNIVIQRLFGDVFDIPSNDINVIPQSRHRNSTPDGEISCECNYHICIESKIFPNSINPTQLAEHKKLSNPAASKYLIYLTPDTSKPKDLVHVEWMSWKTVIERLKGIVNDGITSDLLKFLIEQFILLVNHTVYPNMYVVPIEQSVIIVGGHFGENVALKYGFYACQPNRKFRPSKYLAFYHQNRIKYLFEIIGDVKESVDIQKEATVHESDYFSVIEPYYKMQFRKFFKLKLHTKFKKEIINDKTDKNGKPTAFVQGQTYTTFDKITKASKTSEL